MGKWAEIFSRPKNTSKKPQKPPKKAVFTRFLAIFAQNLQIFLKILCPVLSEKVGKNPEKVGRNVGQSSVRDLTRTKNTLPPPVKVAIRPVLLIKSGQEFL